MILFTEENILRAPQILVVLVGPGQAVVHLLNYFEFFAVFKRFGLAKSVVLTARELI